ncbi:anthranilate phosphoribosyltransferase [Desertifilum sp. FACHB-1129]|uniref:Anthranilate phosphoribosyltransferase n=1 Tax=Desertifilum tharense IPPAS B-1220 TaxID=1781255 RepID=A0A1E5QDY6_9CYAN|nr:MULTISPECIES: anthranilate phosphoribosyltransferase [Desertifilum]MDA0209095.1 anthranilate phosphoribosyltransferase [Cyanobacteria bacterium FC1]MBD2310578.1 anthranilate phosphoribosyltransferase [Desertifilum sp. FACHB-1129]MBD2322030.1 anthranilate phosphoribosyltransferase [Desertifilum sp. FACHB-866]MBD2332157.1 anthranilate phosphoribosyltransferase [Desertifilum sp. FACHB-868]OEJ72880.1 anthranilate phosphoribosyltransferase [Desertifilum tharense IPPAS B-1220]
MTHSPPSVAPVSDTAINEINGPSLLQQLLDGQSLSRTQAADLMQGWLNEAIPPVLSGAILVALQAKGISAEELAGMAQVLQSQVAPIPESYTRYETPVIDTCGTGGDGASTFNISTAVAFVVAAAGVRVAKHGNRSASGKVGSADVLESLGINLAAPQEKVLDALDAVGVTFLFAPGWHPAMKAVVPLRRTLKIRTVFNLLGPLVNPLRPTGQVMGVSSAHLVSTIAQAMQLLNADKAIVLHGREKLDEAGLGDITELAILSEGKVELSAIAPQELNLTPASLEALRGGEVAENAEILRNVLQGKATPAQQDVVALNASLALQVGGAVPLYAHQEGIVLARDIMSSGAAWKKLEELMAFL